MLWIAFLMFAALPEVQVEQQSINTPHRLEYSSAANDLRQDDSRSDPLASVVIGTITTSALLSIAAVFPNVYPADFQANRMFLPADGFLHGGFLSAHINILMAPLVHKLPVSTKTKTIIHCVCGSVLTAVAFAAIRMSN